MTHVGFLKISSQSFLNLLEASHNAMKPIAVRARICSLCRLAARLCRLRKLRVQIGRENIGSEMRSISAMVMPSSCQKQTDTRAQTVEHK